MHSTPASASGYCSPVKSAIAPPCEKPPTTIREAGMPSAFASSISSIISARDSSMPAHSCPRGR